MGFLRSITRRWIVAVFLLTVWSTAALWASCGNIVLEALVRAPIDKKLRETSFEILHSLSEEGRKGADAVFTGITDSDLPSAMSQLLGGRTAEQAKAIFETVNSFEGATADAARAAIAKIAKLPASREIEAGASIAKYLGSPGKSLATKQKFVQDLADIRGFDGADRLLERAATQADLGETVTVAIGAEIKRDPATRGYIVSVDADHGGEITNLKIDVQTTLFGVQSKSKFRNTDVLDLRDFSPSAEVELQALKEQTQARGIAPALASNAQISDDVEAICRAKGIQIWPGFVTIP
jgi:hypothetical protein